MFPLSNHDLLAQASRCRAFDAFAPAHSAFGLPVCVAGVPAAPLCETPWRLTQKPYDFLLGRITRLAIQTIAKTAITHGARNAIATPIMRKLHMIAPALCARVRRSVASGPLWCETMLPWL